MGCIAKIFRLNDPTNADKIKFIMKDQSLADNNYSAICELYPNIIPKVKISDLKDATAGKKTTATAKKPTTNITKPVFDPEFNEKVAILPTSSDKMKILAINYPFEKMLRANIIECMNKIQKIDEKDEIKEKLESFYDSFSGKLVDTLSSSLKKEKLKFENIEQVNNNS